MFEVLHERSMNFVDKTFDRSVISSQNYWLIIIRKLALWFSIDARKIFNLGFENFTLENVPALLYKYTCGPIIARYTLKTIKKYELSDKIL